MQRPGFWDDQDAAARTSAKHAGAQRKLKTFGDLEADIADLDELAEMAAEDEATRSSPSTRGPAAPIHRTGPRSSCACTCAGPSAAASPSR